MKILVRGDCTSRRMLMLNRGKFPGTFSLVTNEKAPNAVFCDHLDGIIANPGLLAQLVDESKMGKSQLLYFRRQFERNVLTETGASLLVIDPYSEMNFQLWCHKSEGWRFWIPRGAIRDITEFAQTFVSEGYRTIEQSVSDTVRVVQRIMSNNPGIPVLFLPQILEFYPALANREYFNDMGSLLKEHIPQLHVGGRIPVNDLIPEDLGTGGGPGLTLHFSGETYWRCAGDTDSMISKVTDAAKTLSLVKQPIEAVSLTVSLQHNSSTCGSACNDIVQSVKTNLQQYMVIEDPNFERTKEVKYRSALIELEKYRDYAEYEGVVKQSGKGARIRQRNKSARLGYECHQFHWRQHIPDIHEINTSTNVRSGGEMRGSYLKSIDEMGGAPSRAYSPAKPKCANHWALPWGVFLPTEGYCQGNQVTNEKLVGYIYLRRFGEFLLYSQILGHYDYLANGVMIHLHHEVIKWVLDSHAQEVQGVKAIMYAGYDQGNEGLRDWKRREAFEPFCLHVSN